MKRIYKKAISVFLVVAMLLCAAPLNGFVGLELPDFFSFDSKAIEIADATSGTCGDNVTWSLDIETGVLNITGTGEMSNGETDDLSNPYRPWLSYRDYIKSVNIGNGITSISEWSFINCSNLSDVTISDSVTSIGSEAFYKCTDLTNITIPDSVTSIGSSAFNKNTQILCNKDSYAQTYAIDNNIAYYLIDGTVEENTISGRIGTKLTWSIDRQTRVLTIDNNGAMVSFASDDAPWKAYKEYVRNVIVNDGCTNISHNAFKDCEHLVSVDLPDTIKTIDNYAFYNCKTLKNITIPNAVSALGDYAFNGCSSLESIAISEGVTSLGYGVFEYCKALEKVTFLSNEKITSIPSNAFYNCTSLNEINIPESVTSIGSYAFYNASLSDKKIEIKNCTIGNCAFESCKNIKSVKLTNCSVGYMAFANSKTSEIDIDDCTINTQYSYTGNAYTFKNCENLKNIALNNTTIPENMFYDCNNIETLIFTGDEDALTIASSSFNNCDRLTSVVVECTDLVIESYAFANCDMLTSTSFKCTKLSLYMDAFCNCKVLENVLFECTNLKIGSYAFDDCDALEAISINCTVSDEYNYISNNAFYDCDNLESAIISAGIDSIDSEAFTSCPNLAKVTIYNKDCEIAETAISIYSTIYGYTGSTAETFANTYGYEFVSIDVPCEHSYSNACDTSCNICGETRETGAHNYSEWTVTKETTCKATGLKERTCSVCGNTEKETIAILDHTFGDWVTEKEATCASYGIRYRICSSCGKEEKLVLDLPNSHTDKNDDGICEVCKKQFEIKYPMHGICGPNLTWTLDDNGVLTIEGTGAMYNFNSGEYITIYTGNDPFTEYETTTNKPDYEYTTLVRPDRPTAVEVTTKRPATTKPVAYPTTSKPNTYPTTNPDDYYYNSINGVTPVEEEPCSVRTEESTTAPNIALQAEIGDNVPTTRVPTTRVPTTTGVPTTTSPSSNNIKIYRWNKHIDKIKKVVIGEGVTSVGEYAFYNCTNLEEVEISGSISSIKYYAFYNCYALDTVNFNAKNCNDIHYNAFNSNAYYNTSVKTLNIGVGVNVIPKFYGLETATFANGATVVPDSAFYDCYNLKNVNLPDSITRIGSNAFYNCYSLSISELPESTTYIGSYAFYNCDAISEFTIGENVETISNYAFYSCSFLETLNFNAKNCYSVSYSAFSYCPIKTLNVGADVSYLPEDLSSVETVTFAEGATAVPANAFYFYTNLRTVNLPDSITSIGEAAFAYCYSLKSFKVGNNVTSIGSYAFYNCSSLRIVSLGENVTEIGKSVFRGSGINALTVNKKLQTIGESAFDSCNSLANVFYKGVKADWDKVVILQNNAPLKKARIYFEDDVTSELNKGLNWSFDSDTGTLYINGEGEIGWKDDELPPWNNHRPDVLKIVIGEGITSLGSALFSDFMCLEEVVLPEGITAIGDWTFDSCIFLSKIELPDTIKSIGDFAFWGCSSLQEIRIPGSVETIGMYAFSNCDNLKEITLENGILKIGGSAFEHCSSLESITIPESVTVIGYDAFYYCTNLSEVVFNAINCTYAGASDDVYSAFYGCENLTDVTIGEKVESIPACFLSRCRNIERIVIPDSVKAIGHHAFWYCDSLIDITIGDNIKEIGGWAFDYTGYFYDEENRRDNLICLDYCLIGVSGYDIVVDDSITVIQDHVFRSHWAIESVELPSWLTEIDDYMFDGCYNLRSIKIPDGVKKIGSYALYNCSNLSQINIPNTVETIGDFAFAYCYDITHMRIPSSVKHIGDTAFYGCDNNVMNLLCEEGSYGCYYAESHRMNLSIFMKEVGGYCIIKNGVLTSFYGEGFDDYEYHCNLVIPSNVKSIGYSAFENNNRIINIELPYSVTTIYPYAFADCPNLESVIIPFTVTDISDSAFEGTDATIYCYYNSYAYNYAVKNGIDYELITVTLSTNSVDMLTGEAIVINAVPSVTVASGIPMVWKSSDSAVVSVDSTGNLVANSVGSATVGVYSFDGTLFDECTITVAEPVDEFENVELKFEDVSTDKLNYGEKILLHINVADLPEGASVKWTTSNGVVLRISNENAACESHQECITCTVESVGSGSAEITGTVVDENGEPILRDDEEIKVSYTMNSKAGFFQKLIAFFKKLFGLSKTILQSME